MKVILMAIALILSTKVYSEDLALNSPNNRQHLGYSEEKISEGIYEIRFSAPRLLFSSSPSWKGWERRAKKVCNGFTYRAIHKEEHISGYIGVMDSVQQKYDVKAYAICDFIKLTDAEIEKIIADHFIPRADVNESVVNDCKENNIPEKQTAFEETENLFIEKRYSEALNCLLNIVSTDDAEYLNKKAYLQLGIIYEVGLGVTPDKSKAMEYYKKSE